jgi:hypothetical protein
MKIERRDSWKRVKELMKLKRLCKMKPIRVRSKRARAANRKRNRLFGILTMNEMTDFEFQRHFRMHRVAFDKLLELMQPHLQVSEEMARRSSGSALSMQARLAVALRFLAGGSYLDISRIYGISIDNFFHESMLWRTLYAIDMALDLGLRNDPEFLEQKSQEFVRLGSDIMRGCVLALDGWVMKTRCPTSK